MNRLMIHYSVQIACMITIALLAYHKDMWAMLPMAFVLWESGRP